MEAAVAAVKAHEVVVVIGATGSGKTTLLPQLLLDQQLGPICVTQPRRVAAIAAAKRVASERGERVGGEVGFAVRFEHKHSETTRLKYVTDGVLLREVVSFPSLPHYRTVMLDEAHERSINTDVLFALMKRLVARRRSGLREEPGPMRIVIASATLDAERMSSFFFGAPIVKLDHAAHPVEILYAAKPTAPQALVESALELVIRVHEERVDSPHDDILVFLTGQEEISTATHALRELVAEQESAANKPSSLLVLPIHASLPSEEQAKVFEPAPQGVRKVIMATNVAETSLTLPGVRVVIDLGMVKEKHYERDKGMEILSVVPISQSSARQRAGRAGRTASGHVYRLYTESQFAQMELEQQPEICRMNLANTVLLLKSMGLNDVATLDWIDPPDSTSLAHAMRVLFLLAALDGDGKLTDRGAEMARLPLEPSLSRVLLASAELECLDECASMCAMAVGEEPFHRAGRIELIEAAQATRAKYDGPEGDHVTLLRVYQDWKRVEPHQRDQWCHTHGLNARAMRMADAVRIQLLGMVREAGVGALEKSTNRMTEGSANQRCRRALCEGLFFQSARRMRGTALFVTYNEPHQTVALRSSSSRALQDAEVVVFSELTWAGRVVMQRVSAVDHGWLEHLLPRLRQYEAQRRMGMTEPSNSKREACTSDEDKSEKKLKTASSCVR
ncbi:MAG: hypothetical protein SGPRY_004235, partial [Prymnesium sp.]